MDATERARLRALCETATPGPWECNGVSVDPEDGYVFARQGANIRGTLIVLDDTYERCGSDMLFVAASRTAIPALLDDLDAVERERDEAVAMLRNLLARVHRDGGQHSDAVGLAQATREADEIIARDIAELARLCEACPSAIVMRPVDPMPLRGLPCACDEWGTGHLDGCPNGGAESVDGRDA